ncbi:hypothetical protein S245_019773 [Arachis hypogaea]
MPSCSRVQSMLQAAVQSLHWTYTIFWQLSPQQRVLRWSDGFYNGEIKVRRTVEAIEANKSNSNNEEASLQRSNQLRDLYDLLLSDRQGDLIFAADPPATPRPCTALSPEDLSESEWYYLMCVSFSFAPGVGLPGKAYARRQHVWLQGANEADTKTFSRAILAKSADVKTVVCIPMLDGVVELGTTDKVKEDINLIKHIKSFFIGDHHRPQPKHALSENSASNPITEEAQLLLDSEIATLPQSKLKELVMAEDSSRAGSPDDGSNRLNSAGLLELLPPESAASLELLHGDEYDNNSEAETSHLCTEQEGHTHYSKTVSTILEGSSGHRPDAVCGLLSFQSAFATWSSSVYNCNQVTVVENPQRLLKNILFRVPYLHRKQNRHNSAQTLEQLERTIMPSPQDDLISSHVAAERRRREKLNEKFITLRSLVPYVTKMDKASILGDTIEYVKQLHEKVKKLEEEDKRRRSGKKRKERAVEVSVIEGEILLEVECMNREGLLLDLMRALKDVGIEVRGVKSSFKGDDERVFVVELRGKVKENGKRNNNNNNKKKISIMEVKKVLRNIINPHHPL